MKQVYFEVSCMKKTHFAMISMSSTIAKSRSFVLMWVDIFTKTLICLGFSFQMGELFNILLCVQCWTQYWQTNEPIIVYDGYLAVI